MNQFVLMLSVGPVQGFISAARRSRDLWSGSWLLSEMAKASACYLYEHKAQMVFPYTTAQDLQAGSEFSVGNKIQVLVEAAHIDEVRQLAQAASEAAKNRFKEVANEAKARLGNKALRSDVWDKQVDDYVEVQSAWARITSLAEYKQTCDQVSAILAARKATRDFQPAALSAYEAALMLPKSSLDNVYGGIGFIVAKFIFLRQFQRGREKWRCRTVSTAHASATVVISHGLTAVWALQQNRL